MSEEGLSTERALKLIAETLLARLSQYGKVQSRQVDGLE
jgi:hypothetical protein